MKYKINLSFRGRGVQIAKLSEEEKDEILEKIEETEDIDEVYEEWTWENTPEYDYEETALDKNVDRFSLEVVDENGNTVYQSEDVNDLIKNKENGDSFIGLPDGFYFGQIQTVKGCCYNADLELDGEFDVNKFYAIRDVYVNEELVGNEIFPIGNICYKRSEEINPEADGVDWEFDSDMGPQYWDTFLMELEDKDGWEDLTD